MSAAPVWRASSHRRQPLETGWELLESAPGGCTAAEASSSEGWIPARVPGTAAAALRDAGRWSFDDLRDFDASDWWFRCRFSAGEAADETALRLGGLATLADVWLNDRHLLTSTAMFEAHELVIDDALQPANELLIRCAALAPVLQARWPRPRWRTRLVDRQALRFQRTTLLGRMPGFAPRPAPVGPWRPVVVEHRTLLAIDHVRLRSRVEGRDGIVALEAELRPLAGFAVDGARVSVEGPTGTAAATVLVVPAHGGVTVRGEVRVPGAALWWPHTHGTPHRYRVTLELTGDAGAPVVELGHVGFRTIEFELDPFELRINGARPFLRGASWLPPDAISLAATEGDTRALLQRVVEAGFNMLRVPGVSVYETDDFHEACDELGLLVWQDLMFANMDYPAEDESFRAAVVREVDGVLAVIAHRPSLAVVCGSSEVEQQAAMLGLDPSLAREGLIGTVLPERVAAAAAGVPYIPSTPTGGDLPFRPGAGVAHYYGVGAYRRPLADARHAAVGFAAECLAFANVPEDGALRAMLPEAPASVVVHHPAWKARSPRDNGSGWDFDDVRDHYLALIFGVDPVSLRFADQDRYLELSRLAIGEVMTAVYGEWRRARSSSQGGLVWWLNDLVPGAGWGIVDALGEPKSGYWFLRRLLAPIATWFTDEGTNGLAVHVANDRPECLDCTLELSFHRGDHVVARTSADIAIAGGGSEERSVEALLGRFVDASYAYRFGPPGHDLVAARLRRGDQALSDAVFHPLGPPAGAQPVESLGLTATAHAHPNGFAVHLQSRSLAYGTRLRIAGGRLDDDYFPVIPGGGHTVLARFDSPAQEWPGGSVAAANAIGTVPIELSDAGRVR